MTTKVIMKDKMKPIEHWNELAEYLQQRSHGICQNNNCTEEEHTCEACAYIRKDGTLLDICIPDYFQGCSSSYAAIPLPWIETGEELKEAVESEIEEIERG